MIWTGCIGGNRDFMKEEEVAECTLIIDEARF